MLGRYAIATLVVLLWATSARADYERFHAFARVYDRGPPPPFSVIAVQRFSGVEPHDTVHQRTDLAAKAGRAA